MQRRRMSGGVAAGDQRCGFRDDSQVSLKTRAALPSVEFRVVVVSITRIPAGGPHRVELEGGRVGCRSAEDDMHIVYRNL